MVALEMSKKTQILSSYKNCKIPWWKQQKYYKDRTERKIEIPISNFLGLVTNWQTYSHALQKCVTDFLVYFQEILRQIMQICISSVKGDI